MVFLQNDMGLKPHDCAQIMGKIHTAEYLILYEASLEMSKELNNAQSKRDFLVAEHNELKGHFK